MQLNVKVCFKGDLIQEFLKVFRSEITKERYTEKLRYFLEYVGVGSRAFFLSEMI